MRVLLFVAPRVQPIPMHTYTHTHIHIHIYTCTHIPPHYRGLMLDMVPPGFDPRNHGPCATFFFQRHVTDTHLSSCDLHTKIPKMLRTPPHQLIYLTNTSKSHTGIPCPVAMSLNRILPRIHTIHISNSPECS